MASAELTSKDLESILQFTVTLARTAGKVILEGSDAILSAAAETESSTEKKNSVDLVTEYDVRVEELVKKEIREAYPQFDFIGEESYAAGARPPLTDSPTFCVDPIDGTTNFIHGFPFVCISLGLIYKRRPVIGVIYNPFLDHLYTGITGQGSHVSRHGNTPLRLPLTHPNPKPLKSLSQALLAVEWGSARTVSVAGSKAASFLRLAGDPTETTPGDASTGVAGGKMAHSLRSMGSAALAYSMVAQGALDAYWEIGCWPWDVCAGIVIAQEAGCVVVGSHADVAATIGTATSPSSGTGAGNSTFGDVSEEILTGRKYLVVRAIGDTPAETGVETQKRIIREFYDTVADCSAD